MNFPNATPLEWAWVAVALVALGYAVFNLRWAIRNLRYQHIPPRTVPDWVPDPDLVHIAGVQVWHRVLSLGTISFFVLAGVRQLFYQPLPGATWDSAALACYAIVLLVAYTGWAIWLNRDEARLRARYAARQDAEQLSTEDTPTEAATQHLEEVH